MNGALLKVEMEQRIFRIYEHSVDLNLLPKKAYILDIGCRGFEFTDYFKQQGHNVYSVDVDSFPGKTYNQCAITGEDGFVHVVKTDDPQGTFVRPAYIQTDIRSYTLQSFSDEVGVKAWDLIKIDVEGSEYGIIKSLHAPIARQISIEFHLHTGKYTEQEVTEMVGHLAGLGYWPVKHEKTSEHGAGFNYWDSLFVI